NLVFIKRHPHGQPSFWIVLSFFFFFQAEDGIRDLTVTGVQTCALPISTGVGKTEQELRQRLGQLGLADAGRPEEEQHAIRAVEEIGRASCRERVLSGGGGGW